MRCDKETGNRKGSSIVLVPEDPQTRQPLPPSAGKRAAKGELKLERKRIIREKTERSGAVRKARPNLEKKNKKN